MTDPTPTTPTPPEGLTDEQLIDVINQAYKDSRSLLAAQSGPLSLDRFIARAAIAADRADRPAPAPNELSVSLRIDLSTESLKRLCDGLAAAVKPDGGYAAAASDDLPLSTGGEQMVQVEWWIPQHGCDSLENTLDAIKARILFAVRDWLATALAPTPAPAPTPEELEAQFRAWWKASYPNAPAGGHAVASHVAFGLHLLRGVQ
jgi:hypothetical protein